MIDSHDAATGLAVLLAAGSLALHRRRKKFTLAQIARLACDHAERHESPTVPRMLIAREAASKIDLSDNGTRDYSAVQLSMAVDAEALRRGWSVR